MQCFKPRTTLGVGSDEKIRAKCRRMRSAGMAPSIHPTKDSTHLLIRNLRYELEGLHRLWHMKPTTQELDAANTSAVNEIEDLQSYLIR